VVLLGRFLAHALPKRTTTLTLRRSTPFPALLENDSLEKFEIFGADRSR